MSSATNGSSTELGFAANGRSERINKIAALVQA
jgi:hypothetical protein